MLLRGMHDHRCDDIFIIVTDLKRQEMDDVTEYFKLVCKHTFGRTLKPSMEQKLLYERQSPPPHFPFPTFDWQLSRYAIDSCAGSPPQDTLFPPNRSHLPCHLARTHATFHHPFLPPDHLILANILYPSRIRPGRGNILRFPKWLS